MPHGLPLALLALVVFRGLLNGNRIELVEDHLMHDKDYAPSASEVLAARDAALECLAWTTPSYDEDGGDANGYLEDHDGAWHDSALAAIETIISDFIAANNDDLHGLSYSDIGHNLILSANGHGTGFWDMGLGERGERLHDMAAPYGSLDAYVGDGGFIHLSVYELN